MYWRMEVDRRSERSEEAPVGLVRQMRALHFCNPHDLWRPKPSLLFGALRKGDTTL